MINSIKITDLSEADNIARGLKETNCNAWICTIDENDTERGYGIKNLFEKRNIPCYLDFFYDIDDEALGTMDNFEIIKSIPREDNIRKIMNFIQNLVSSDEQYNVGINCFAGFHDQQLLEFLHGCCKDCLQKMLLIKFWK
jgi:hypothetical protein